MDKTRTAVILLIVVLAIMGVVIYALRDQIFGSSKKVEVKEKQQTTKTTETEE